MVNIPQGTASRGVTTSELHNAQFSRSVPFVTWLRLIGEHSCAVNVISRS